MSQHPEEVLFDVATGKEDGNVVDQNLSETARGGEERRSRRKNRRTFFA